MGLSVIHKLCLALSSTQQKPLGVITRANVEILYTRLRNTIWSFKSMPSTGADPEASIVKTS